MKTVTTKITFQGISRTFMPIHRIKKFNFESFQENFIKLKKNSPFLAETEYVSCLNSMFFGLILISMLIFYFQLFNTQLIILLNWLFVYLKYNLLVSNRFYHFHIYSFDESSISKVHIWKNNLNYKIP